ncbi:hypothetical protein, partial [Flavobacterium sp.]|uniref:hypothetical protein n=1 Tax=Flavobacterium sp. TaxID=239 RepID=UPI002FDD5516
FKRSISIVLRQLKKLLFLVFAFFIKMKNNYLIGLLTILIIFIFACSESNGDDYTPVSPVTVDLTQVPYPKLSDYKFFEGEMKNQKPSLNVLPYEPLSSLFSDYAHKKRFVWMPPGTKAIYNSDNTTLELPVGAVIIKTFYYDNVQPSNTTKIIETRLMIRKSSGWIFADYVWNDEQTEAYFDLNGRNIDISWKDENNVIRNVNYRVPNEVQCNVCHKYKETIDGEYIEKHVPIGIKPQNLNSDYTYGTQTKNQLLKWVEQGYLENNFNLPNETNTVVDYNDASKPLEKRVRSYLDINCAHCHNTNGHCDYRPMRFPFGETGGVNGHTNMGVCVPTEDMQDFPPTLNTIIKPGSSDKSMLFYRINTTNEYFRMPLHGRSLIHDEGVALMAQWISSLTDCL